MKSPGCKHACVFTALAELVEGAVVQRVVGARLKYQELESQFSSLSSLSVSCRKGHFGSYFKGLL